MTNEQNIAEQIRQLTSRIIYLEGEVSILRESSGQPPRMIPNEEVGGFRTNAFVADLKKPGPCGSIINLRMFG